ncbi:hypothetical protein BLNAU_4135 [Blattamonas nauphoetae]|uniref:Secreted protein n=1 Tax=Blattamonas nauphoetae TaxID=2049346 RepID=A0ABQ9YAU6_9EUKA|nr:hypothetical protein BLNAU_4135 [Blattamonas nauphoetae]
MSRQRLSSVALISTSCSVSMSNCRFSSIVVLEGHGSVLRADASNTARVSVLNTHQSPTHLRCCTSSILTLLETQFNVDWILGPLGLWTGGTPLCVIGSCVVVRCFCG